jgi:hypothetical protein
LAKNSFGKEGKIEWRARFREGRLSGVEQAR